MIKIYNIKRELVSTTSKYKSMEINREINQIDKLRFYTDKETGGKIKLEGYIETSEGVFVVKENALSVDYSILAHMDLEEFDKFVLNIKLERMKLKEMVSKLTEGSGWTIVGDSEESKTITIEGLSKIDAIFKCVNLFSYEIRFNNIKKEITIGKTIGEDRGVYFHNDLNLRSLNMSSDTYDYATRLIPKGKEGLGIESVNDGVPYVENYTFTNKIITKLWIDERYTIAENLKSDAEARLAEIAKPMSYLECSVADLSSHSDYDFLSYDVGDYIFLIDKELNVKEKYRIGSIRLFPKSVEDSLVVIENRPRDINERFKAQEEEIQMQHDVINNQNDRLSNIENMLGISNDGDGGWDDTGSPGGPGGGWGDDTVYYNPTQLTEAIPSLKIGLVSWADISDGDSVDYNSKRKVLNVRDYFTKEVIYTQDELDKRPTLENIGGRRWLSFNPDPKVLQRWKKGSDVPWDDLIVQHGQYLENLLSESKAITIYVAYYDRTPEMLGERATVENGWPAGFSSPIGYPQSGQSWYRNNGLSSPSLPGQENVFFGVEGFSYSNRGIARVRNENVIARLNNNIEDEKYQKYKNFLSLGMNKESYDSIRTMGDDYRPGYIYDMNAFFTGEIGEVIVYSREVDSREHREMVNYLENKYNAYRVLSN